MAGSQTLQQTAFDLATDGVRVMQIIDAALRSQCEGMVIPIEPV